jgi:prepilin-type N-terminal cleavage/methylation domain-containing protein
VKIEQQIRFVGPLLMRRSNPSWATRRCRAAFSVIELLVAMAIISVLISLIAAAVLQSREAVRRIQCRNHLRQLTLATHNFQGSFEALPPLEIANSWATWAVFLMPYLDQSPAYSEWDLFHRYHVQRPTAGRDWPVFHCPSRTIVGNSPATATAFYKDGLRTGPLGWSDYGACGGTQTAFDNGALVRAIDQTTGAPSQQGGASISALSTAVHPGWRLCHKLRDLEADGLSCTLLFGETHRPVASSVGPVFCGNNNRNGYARIVGGRSTDLVKFPLVSTPTYAGADWGQRFGSAHPGSCHFGLADGSVRAISVSIDLEVLDRLARRSDGQPVSLD